MKLTMEQRATRTIVDTILVTPKDVKEWLHPPFQRPVKENEKVRALAEKMKNDHGVFPGVVTLGIIDKKTYTVDGQHRVRAFLISGLAEGYVDIRKVFFNDMGEAGAEFVQLNSSLSRMTPDAVLKGLEFNLPTLQYIRKHADFVGYDSIRRNEKAPVVSMSAMIRSWRQAANPIPSYFTAAAQDIAAAMDLEDAKGLCAFLNCAFEAFGRAPEYYRMWNTLNMVLTMWLYRRLVLKFEEVKNAQPISNETFRKCLMSLSANAVYLDWLVGRKMCESDRSPAYNRIKDIFAERLRSEGVSKPILPRPEWAR